MAATVAPSQATSLQGTSKDMSQSIIQQQHGNPMGKDLAVKSSYEEGPRDDKEYLPPTKTFKPDDFTIIRTLGTGSFLRIAIF